MKKKFSKILGIGLTLALLTSLLLTAAPVSALSVPTVGFPATTDDDISRLNATYDITFVLGKELAGTGVVLLPTARTVNDSITITFDSGYTIAAPTAPLSASPGWLSTASPATWGGPTAANTGALTFSATAKTITYTLGVNEHLGQGATVRFSITAGITNPSAIDSYSLTVKTSQETTAASSAAYSIVAPTISALPGIVSIYNEAGVLMDQKSGSTAIADAITAAVGITKPVIKLDAGTYTENPNTATASTTFMPTGTAAETIIKGNWTIDVASVTLDSLTLTGTVDITSATGNKATIKNCIFNKLLTTTEVLVAYNNTFATTGTGTISGCTFDTTKGTVADTAIDINQLGLTVSGGSFTLDAGDKAIDIGANATIKDITNITGTGGIGVDANAGTATVSGSTFDGLQNAFDIDGGTLTITGNTIKNCTGSATVGQEGAITIDGATTVVKISSNDINTTKATIYAVYLDTLVVAGTATPNVYVLFNNINNTLNIKNEDATADKLNATHNYWGAATAPASTSISGDVNTANYLKADVTATKASFSTGAATLTAKTTASVDVSVTTSSGATSATVSIIGAANYAANPGTATPYTALADGFYDVYLTDSVTTDVVTILLYNAGVTANTEVYVMNALTGEWTKCAPLSASNPATQGVNTASGYAYVTVKGITTIPAITDLTGTVFALVTAPTVATALDAPTIIAPDGGERDMPLTPTFSWTQIVAADGYYFQLADNANFVAPLVKLDGDLGRLIVTAYAQVSALDYSSAYYWRVKAVSGSEAAANLKESSWSTGVFITMDVPEEPTPPIIVEEVQPPVIVIEETPPPIIKIEPIVEVVTPPATPITPVWIYIIIGVGAVLVIALIVLVVRTRRVA